MIGSTLSRMAAAEKLSIPQLQRAIQDGTIPAYVGIPLLQDKVKMEQQAKMAAGAQQGKAPTVADQVMQQASAEEAQSRMPQGVDQLPVEAPTMAGGGIVAFADGGDAEDQDYADYMQEAEDDEDDARQAGLLKKLSLMSSPDMSYKDVSQGKLAAAEKVGAYKGITGDHKYSDLIRSEAKKVGLDPEYALKIAMIETGGLKNPESARSKAGAIGIMQLMPATAKGLGVDPTVPEENVRGGVSMLKRLVDKYGDYQLAGAAYNAGEGRVDRALRSSQGLAGLPNETQGYMGKIRGMKEGGIAGFAGDDGSYVDEYFGVGPEKDYLSREINPADLATPESAYKQHLGVVDLRKQVAQSSPEVRGYVNQYGSQLLGSPDLATFQKDPTAYVKSKQAEYAKAHPAPAAGSDSGTGKGAGKGAGSGAGTTTTTTTGTDTGTGIKTVPTETKPSETKLYDQFIEQWAKNQGERANQAEQDKYMSLLTAGLGMMGGTSPYAAANIGQGAMAGISNYANMRKQAAAQEAADVKNMLLAQKYKESGELARATQAAAEGYKKQELGIRTEAAASEALARNQRAFDQYTKEREAAIEKQYGSLMVPAAKTALEQLYSSPEYANLRSKAYPDLPATTAGTTLPQGVIVRPR